MAKIINTTFEKTEPVKPREREAFRCSNCDGQFFSQVVKILKISAVEMVAAGQANKDGILPIPFFKCDTCGEILEELNPQK